MLETHTFIVYTYCISVGVFSAISSNLKADSSGLSGCSYPGDAVVYYKCTILLWSCYIVMWKCLTLPLSSNNWLILLHSHYMSTGVHYKICNYGDIIAQSLIVQDGCYSSQVTVTVRNGHELNQWSIECLTDNGTLCSVGNSYICPVASRSIPLHVNPWSLNLCAHYTHISLYYLTS